MKTDHGLKMQVLRLSVILLIFWSCFYAHSKTLRVDEVTPSVTNGDFTITPNGTGDIVLGVNSGFVLLTSGVLSTQEFIDITTDISGVLPIANGGTGSSTKNFTDLTSNQTISGAKTFDGKFIASSTSNGFKPCPSMTEAQRDSISSPQEGDCVVNSDTNELNFYLNSLWGQVGGGGFTSPTTTQGDLIYRNATQDTRLGIGADGQVLTVSSGEPTWQDASGGGGGSAGINFVVDSSFEKNDLAFTNSLSGTTTYPLYTSNDKLYSEFNEVYFQIAHTGLSAANYSTSYTVTRTGLDGKQGLVSIWAKTAAELDLCVDVDTNGCDTTLTLINDDTWRKYEVPVVFGSGNVLLKFVNASITGDVTLQLDNVYVGTMPDGYIQNVGQAHFVGSATWGTDCYFTDDPVDSLSFTDYDSDTTCTRSSSGNLAVNANGFSFDLNNARTDGVYTIHFNAQFLTLYRTSPAACQWSITDGINYYALKDLADVVSGENLVDNDIVAKEIRFTSNGNKTIKIQKRGRGNTGVACLVDALSSDIPFKATVHFFPDSSSTIVSQDTETLWGKYYLNTTQTIDGGANEVIIFDAKFSGKEGGNLDNFYNASTGILTNTGKERCFEITANVLMISVSQNTRPFLTVNKNGTIAVYSSDVMGNTVTNPMLQISSGTQCLKDGETLAVAAQTGDVNNRDIVASQINNISIREVNNSATIVGKFENINSSDLVEVIGAGTAGGTLTASVTPINFIETKDNYNAWDGTTFQAPKASFYKITGNYYYFPSIEDLTRAYMDTDNDGTYETIRVCGAYHESDIKHFSCGFELPKDAKLQLRTYTASGQALQTSTVWNNISITEQPDYEAIVKNLSNQKTKCQTKVLSGNTSTPSAIVADLTFTNLDPNKKYNLFLNHSHNSCNLVVLVNSTTYAQSVFPPSANAYVTGSYYDINNPTGDIEFRTAASCSTLFGFFASSGDRGQTFARLCELPDTYVETTEF